MRGRHVVASRRGGPEVLDLRTRELPPPEPGQAQVRVLAAGVSFGDVLLRVGVIPVGPKPPFTPGYDVTGVVEAVGDGVRDPSPGQMVTALVPSGGYAEFANVPARRLVPVPDGLDPTLVAAAVLNYFVAYQMLHRVVAVRPGDRVLVHGAAGGVGTAFLQLGKLAGVDCFGTASSAKGGLVTDLGGHHIDYRSDDFLRVVRSRPGGSVDAVFDPVGGAHFLRSYRALRRGGTLVGYGQSRAMKDGRRRRPVAIFGFIGGLFLPKLVPDGKKTTFYNAWSLEKEHPEAYREDITTLLGMLGDGKIRPVVAETLPLDEAAKAHELLERAAIGGKIVLTRDP